MGVGSTWRAHWPLYSAIAASQYYLVPPSTLSFGYGIRTTLPLVVGFSTSPIIWCLFGLLKAAWTYPTSSWTPSFQHDTIISQYIPLNTDDITKNWIWSLLVKRSHQSSTCSRLEMFTFDLCFSVSTWACAVFVLNCILRNNLSDIFLCTCS